MGTPFAIEILEEGVEQPKSTMVASFNDGYPEWVVPFLKRTYDAMVQWAKKRCEDNPEFGHPENYGYMRGDARTVASFLCATEPTRVFPACQNCGPHVAGQTYRLYLVNCLGGRSSAENPMWEVEVERFRVPLDELAKRYEEE